MESHPLWQGKSAWLLFIAFMEAPDDEGIQSPPMLGHLLPWLHLHPGAWGRIRRSLLLMFRPTNVDVLAVHCHSVWLKSFVCYNSVEVRWIVYACWEQEDGGEQGQNVVTETPRCSLHPSTCSLTQEHYQGSPAICWSLVELHPCFHLKLTNSDWKLHIPRVLILSEPKLWLTSSGRLLTGKHWLQWAKYANMTASFRA